ncbi:unnamed protein product [Amoebophrya sp. A25]|nr:unnamed protein product [Amoebophrya sp. A25]|eukprot:GSA25T00016920001.1
MVTSPGLSAGGGVPPGGSPGGPFAGTEFGEILQHAVQIKGQQSVEKRKRFESLPQFTQHSLFFGERDEMQRMREWPFEKRLEKATELKKLGNQLFSKGQCVEAIHQYELAAALFVWVESRDPAWKKSQRGIDDDVLVVVEPEAAVQEIGIDTDAFLRTHGGSVSTSLCREDGNQVERTSPTRARHEKSKVLPSRVQMPTPDEKKEEHQETNSNNSTTIAPGSFTSGGSSSSTSIKWNSTNSTSSEDVEPERSNTATGNGTTNNKTNPLYETEAHQTAVQFRETCALNIAAAFLKQQEWAQCRKVCTFVLQHNPGSVKALYRRAQALLGPAGCGNLETDLALEDLAQALKVQPDAKEVRDLYNRCKAERDKSNRKEATAFRGIFRGEKDFQLSDHAEDGADQTHKKDAPPLPRKIMDAIMLRDLYYRNGKIEDAIALDKQIEAAKAAFLAPVDYYNPTPQMIEDAKKHDIDLTDPLVQAELAKLEERKRNGESVTDLVKGLENEEALLLAEDSAGGDPSVIEGTRKRRGQGRDESRYPQWQKVSGVLLSSIPLPIRMIGERLRVEMQKFLPHWFLELSEQDQRWWCYFFAFLIFGCAYRLGWNFGFPR